MQRISDRRLQQAVWLWSLMLLGTCVRPLVQPGRSDLTLLWGETGLAWILGQTPYHTANEFESFRYSPLMAAACVPLALMPPFLLAVLWRLASAAFLLSGLRAWLRDAAPTRLSDRQTGWLLLLVAPLSLGSLNNGQANTILTGLLLFSLADVASKRWNRAALWLGLATWLKVYPIALALLLILIYPRRLTHRYLVSLLVLAMLPFLSQSPHYVAQQYGEWFELLRTNDTHRRFLPVEHAYRDLLLLLRLWRIPITSLGFTLLQLIGAMLCAWSCLHGLRQGQPRRLLLQRTFVVCLCWMMLLGPATESNTYVLIAPLVGWLAVWIHTHGTPTSRYLMGQSVGLLLLCVVSCVVPAGRTRYHAAGLQPLAILLLLVAYFLAERASLALGMKRRLRLWKHDSDSSKNRRQESEELEKRCLLEGTL